MENPTISKRLSSLRSPVRKPLKCLGARRNADRARPGQHSAPAAPELIDLVLSAGQRDVPHGYVWSRRDLATSLSLLTAAVSCLIIWITAAPQGQSKHVLQSHFSNSSYRLTHGKYVWHQHPGISQLHLNLNRGKSAFKQSQGPARKPDGL
jgi:hypothetical protein